MFADLASHVVAVANGLHGVALYVLVGVLAFGESAILLGVVLPGGTAVLVGAALAAQGRAQLVTFVLVVVLAGLTGDSVGYEVGRRLGPRLRTGRLGRRIG